MKQHVVQGCVSDENEVSSLCIAIQKIFCNIYRNVHNLTVTKACFDFANTLLFLILRTGYNAEFAMSIGVLQHPFRSLRN